MHFCTNMYSLESDTQRNGHNECIDLKHTQEEQPEVVEHLCEEVPEETIVRGQIRNKQPRAGRREGHEVMTKSHKKGEDKCS